MDAEVEDKTCRICGFVDTSNINIFDSKFNNLLTKILTVFPIIIYETDPLPKNICRKCVTNVSLMFDETSKLFKVQKKWIDNVRQNQPNHPYFQIMDLIKNSTRRMISDVRRIETNFPHREPRIYPNWLAVNEDVKDVKTFSPPASSSAGSLNFIKGRIPNDELPVVKREPPKSVASPPQQFSFIKNKDVTIGPPKRIVSPEKQPVSAGGKPIIAAQIKELQHKLQSNGCTLSFSSGMKPRPPMPNFSRFGEKCKFCHATFSNVQFLAKHQLGHMVLSDRRIFDKKYLDKKIRRGRLIPKGDKKCIRCLNCWKLFVDNRGILDHWSNGDCEFYCQICGKEFASNPKMLREHVPAAHGISYKSSRRRSETGASEIASDNGSSKADMANFSLSIDFPSDIQIKTEPADDDDDDDVEDMEEYKPKRTPLLFRPKPSKQKNNLKTSRVRCHICGVEFSNFRSKNSHMRKHKVRNPVPPKIEPPTEFTIKKEKEDSFEEIEMQVEPLMHPYMDTSEEEKPRLQVKKLSDLQDPSVSSQHSDDEQKPEVADTIDQSTEVVTKKEDHMEYGKIYNCHPCGKQFSSKTELFEHKRQCQSNNKFACGFCLRAFITSADLQMHIMLMHRDS